MKCSLVVTAAVVGLSLAGLSGCGAPDVRTASSPVIAQAGSAHSGPVMTIKEARTTYLELSAASNAARDAWMGAPRPTTANLAKHKKLAARAAKATLAFSQGLRGHRWPSQTQPLIDALDGYLQQRAAAYQRVATAGTVDEYLAAAGQVPVTNSVTGAVRRTLGLPEGAVVQGATPA